MATKSIAQTVNTSNFAGKQKSVLRDLFEANASLNSITPTGGALTVTGSIRATDGISTAYATADGGTAAITVRNTNTHSTSLAAYKMQTDVSGNVWQMFARNNSIFWGVSGVADYMNLTSSGLAVTGSIRATANVTFSGLPTSASGLPSGGLWNDGGTIKIA